MVQGHAQGVEGLVVVQDALAFAHVGGHAARLGADGAAALLGLALLQLPGAAGGALAVQEGPLGAAVALLVLSGAQHAQLQLLLGELRSRDTTATAHLRWSLQLLCKRVT